MNRGRPRVKICGMMRGEDAHFAARAGVDALGFIFYKKSPRCVAIETAQAIIPSLPPFIDKVGVFVNASMGEIKKAVALGLTALQLHGDESPQYCQELRAQFASLAIIKAFRVGSRSRAAEFSPYKPVVDAFLLDTYVKGAKGGTGEIFDWNIIEKLDLERPVLLAGGLEPENIERAIRATESYCYDVNSGVEVSPGIKDHGRIERLMSVVQKIAAE